MQQGGTHQRFNGPRAALERILLSWLRLYTYHTPISKGKYRLAETAVKNCTLLPAKAAVPTRDGRTLFANLTSGTQTSVYFHGTYETVLTSMVTQLVREGDVCVDVGANFGWYTTLLRDLCGPSGEVHAFEPVPTIFDELVENCRLIGSPENVLLNMMALGDTQGRITVNTFAGLSDGHASMSDRGRSDVTSYTCPIDTFDNYAASQLQGG